MEFLKSFELDLWWNKLIAVGLAIIVAAVAAKERDLIFIGLGMVAWGFGESQNHKKMIEWTPPSAYIPQGTITSYPRFPHPFGIALDAIGILLILFGLYRLVAT